MPFRTFLFCLLAGILVLASPRSRLKAAQLPSIDLALISRDQNKAVALFQKGTPVNGAMQDGTPFLIEASRRSLAKVVSHLLASNANLAQTDKEGRTALQVAARSKADVVLPLLLASKAFDIDAADPEGLTPLLYASTHHPEAVTLLLKAGADPNLPSGNSPKITPLEQAANQGKASIVAVLIQGGAQAEGKAGARAVRFASSYDTEDHARTILALAKAGADLNGEPLWKSLEYNRHKCLAALLEGGADVNQRGLNEITPLIHAVAIDQNRASLEILLRFKPQLELKARFPFAFHGFPDIPPEERYHDSTALMCAARAGRLDLVKLLLRAGAQPATKDRHGSTAADLAKDAGKSEVAAYLQK